MKLLILTLLLVTGNAMAQERAAAGSLETQMTWSALTTQISGLKTQVDGANTRVDQVVICGKKGMLYAPGATGADSQGCLSATMPVNCTQQYTTKDLGGDRKYPNNYGLGKLNTCIANAPDPSWQVSGYDVCFEDAHDCTNDGLLCIYSKTTCK